MDFYLELHVCGVVPVSKKNEIRDSRAGFNVFPRSSLDTFILCAGHSLVELTEHDDSAADIILHSM